MSSLTICILTMRYESCSLCQLASESDLMILFHCSNNNPYPELLFSRQPRRHLVRFTVRDVMHDGTCSAGKGFAEITTLFIEYRLICIS